LKFQRSAAHGKKTFVRGLIGTPQQAASLRSRGALCMDAEASPKTEVVYRYRVMVCVPYIPCREPCRIPRRTGQHRGKVYASYGFM